MSARLSPDDPRHGTTRGYHAGCRLPCCAHAVAIYEKRRRLQALAGAPPRLVPAHGTRRRLQALARIGWPLRELGARLGLTQQALHLSMDPTRAHVTRARHTAVRRLYRDLHATTGPSPVAAARAAGKGWPPPYAWEDPDNAAEDPSRSAFTRHRTPGTRTPAQRRAAHAAYKRGERDDDTVAGEREYQRLSRAHRRDQARRAAA